MTIQFRKSALILLALLMASGCAAQNPGSADNSASEDSTDKNSQEKQNTVCKAESASIEDGAILHAFSWDFDTIRKSLPMIAASGFNAVQTSPINEVLAGEDGGMDLYGEGKWYYHYQPTDWTIGNYQLGTLDEFRALCQEAEKYGISIMVDVVPNHTTPTTEAVSESLIQAAGSSLDDLYHENSKYDMSNFSDRLQLTTYKMGGLPDVNTENPGFQDYFLEFLDQAIDAGADGFRFDTAKHIGLEDDPTEKEGVKNNFWTRVNEKLKEKNIDFAYGEVLQGGKDRIADYIGTIGAATASSYGEKIRYAIALKNLNPGSLTDYAISGANPDIVTWVESHDNYINDGNWKEMSEDQVILAYALIGSRKDGTPLFFDRPYQSSTEDQWGENRIGVSGSNFYMDPAVRAVNYFRQAMTGEDETLVNPNEDSTALLIERGNKGLVIVNLKRELETGFEVNLEDGEYIDQTDQTTRYKVKDGILSSDQPIAADSVTVLYQLQCEQPAAPVVIELENAQFETESDTENPVVHLSNAEEAVWKIHAENSGDGNSTDKNKENQEKEGTLRDGDSIEIDLSASPEVTLEIEAENEEGLTSWKEFVFRRKESQTVPTGTTVRFEKPENWSDNIRIYIYSDEDDGETMTWPGVKMEKDQNEWIYTFERDWNQPLIIFNDGTDQYPAANAAGLPVEDGKTYTAE